MTTVDRTYIIVHVNMVLHSVLIPWCFKDSIQLIVPAWTPAINWWTYSYENFDAYKTFNCAGGIPTQLYLVLRSSMISSAGFVKARNQFFRHHGCG
jgi:hypothetical protein